MVMISTHAPLAGRDPNQQKLKQNKRISTHAPLAGRDFYAAAGFPWNKYFNPRAPCGARQAAQWILLADILISTHAPLAGRDQTEVKSENKEEISTHAPLAGRDTPTGRASDASKNFNPRAPCGARQQKCTNHYAHFCDNRQISDAFAQNAACQGILLLFDAGKPCGFWVRTAQVVSARLCFAL